MHKSTTNDQIQAMNIFEVYRVFYGDFFFNEKEILISMIEESVRTQISSNIEADFW